MLFKIRFPSALPSLFAGLKVAVSFALVGAIVGEFVAGSKGLGFQILTAQGQFDTVRVFVSLVLLGIAGTLLFFLVDYIECLRNAGAANGADIPDHALETHCSWTSD